MSATGPNAATLPAFASNLYATLAEWSVVVLAVAVASFEIGHGYQAAVIVTTVAIAPLVVWIVAQDLMTFTIADGAVVALAVLALATRVVAGDPAILLALDVLLSGGVLLAFREIYYRRRGFDGLGLGDVKLAAAGGLLVGAGAFAWALLGASLLALLGVAIVYGIARTRHRSIDFEAYRKLAFGALLAPALYAAWIVQALPILWPAGG